MHSKKIKKFVFPLNHFGILLSLTVATNQSNTKFRRATSCYLLSVLRGSTPAELLEIALQDAEAALNLSSLPEDIEDRLVSSLSTDYFAAQQKMAIEISSEVELEHEKEMEDLKAIIEEKNAIIREMSIAAQTASSSTVITDSEMVEEEGGSAAVSYRDSKRIMHAKQERDCLASDSIVFPGYTVQTEQQDETATTAGSDAKRIKLADPATASDSSDLNFNPAPFAAMFSLRWPLPPTIPDDLMRWFADC